MANFRHTRHHSKGIHPTTRTFSPAGGTEFNPLSSCVYTADAPLKARSKGYSPDSAYSALILWGIAMSHLLQKHKACGA